MFPPLTSDITLSRWLYLMISHFFDAQDEVKAGEYLWRVQSYLPGGFSNSWLQILEILSSAPEHAFHEPRIWVFARIAKRILEKLETTDFETSCWVLKNPLFDRIPPTLEVNEAKFFEDLVANYLNGIDEFVDWRGDLSEIETLFWGIV